jgi:hypothetical protein
MTNKTLESDMLAILESTEGVSSILTWTTDGDAVGIGNEVSGTLVAGYSFVDDKWLDTP